MVKFPKMADKATRVSVFFLKVAGYLRAFWVSATTMLNIDSVRN